MPNRREGYGHAWCNSVRGLAGCDLCRRAGHKRRSSHRRYTSIQLRALAQGVIQAILRFLCHGLDGKESPRTTYAFMLKVPPADLSTLAKRHAGKFPYDYVSAVLRFGPSSTILHGSADMPTWGPIFQYLDKNNERAVLSNASKTPLQLLGDFAGAIGSAPPSHLLKSVSTAI